MILLLALAAAAAAPQPGQLRTFGDWIVGCDNGLGCQAVALFPEPELTGASLTLKREAEAGAVPEIWLTLRDETGGQPQAAALIVDGQRFALAADRKGSPAPRDPAGVAARIGQSKRISVLDDEGKELGLVSVKGSAAALLYVDEQQRRLGTTGALVRRGPATQIPPPQALPMVVEMKGSGAVMPVPLSHERIDKLRKAGECDPDLDLADYRPEARRLDGRTTLVLIRCWQAAYNGSSLVLVGRKGDGSDLAPARFDYTASAGERIGPAVPPDGAYWDEEKSRLASFFKGRGLGDCGSGQEWAWDGTRFRLVHEEAMGECRGSTDYITTWRAVVR